MAPLESISTILARPGFNLTPQPARLRRGGGVDRGRSSNIRRPHAPDCPEREAPTYLTGAACTCGKQQRQAKPTEEKIARRYRRMTHRPGWIMRGIVRLLMEAPECAAFSPPVIAAVLGCSERSVQNQLAKLRSRRCYEELDATGGRGNRLLIKSDRRHLAAFAARLGLQPTVASWRALLREWRARRQRQAPAAASLVLQQGPDRKGANSLIPSEGNSASVCNVESAKTAKPPTGRPPPDKNRVRQYLRQAKRSLNASKCGRGLCGAVRNAAWFRGLAYAVSQIYVQVLDEAAARFGKRHSREVWASNVVVRLLEDGNPPPAARSAIRRWQYEAQEWTAQWQEQRRQQAWQRQVPPREWYQP
jgi:hypothetical protein